MATPAEPQAILILGATGGIGSALARRLAAQGCRLTLAARDRAKLEALAAELAADVQVLAATEGDAVERCVAAASERWGRLQGAVNCVAPGLTRTPLALPLTKNESSLKAACALHPLGRIGEPEDVASAIAWIHSPEQSWVTGQVLAVDGGLSSVQARPAANG